MMNNLNCDNMNEFLDRFDACNDGVIRLIDVSTTGASTCCANIIVSTVDKLATENDGWVNLRFEVQGVSKWPSDIGDWANEVLSDGIKIGFFNNELLLDLAPYTDEPDGRKDFEKSEWLFIGRECNWSVAKYSEDFPFQTRRTK